MQQLIIHIKDRDKTEVLLNFLRSLSYITVEQVTDDEAELSDEQKYLLDERRTESQEFITWNEAKKQLYTKK